MEQRRLALRSSIRHSNKGSNLLDLPEGVYFELSFYMDEKTKACFSSTCKTLHKSYAPMMWFHQCCPDTKGTSRRKVGMLCPELASSSAMRLLSIKSTTNSPSSAAASLYHLNDLLREFAAYPSCVRKLGQVCTMQLDMDQTSGDEVVQCIRGVLRLLPRVGRIQLSSALMLPSLCSARHGFFTNPLKKISSLLITDGLMDAPNMLRTLPQMMPHLTELQFPVEQQLPTDILSQLTGLAELRLKIQIPDFPNLGQLTCCNALRRLQINSSHPLNLNAYANRLNLLRKQLKELRLSDVLITNANVLCLLHIRKLVLSGCQTPPAVSHAIFTTPTFNVNWGKLRELHFNGIICKTLLNHLALQPEACKANKVKVTCDGSLPMRYVKCTDAAAQSCFDYMLHGGPDGEKNIWDIAVQHDELMSDILALLGRAYKYLNSLTLLGPGTTLTVGECCAIADMLGFARIHVLYVSKKLQMDAAAAHALMKIQQVDKLWVSKYTKQRLMVAAAALNYAVKFSELMGSRYEVAVNGRGV